jgi:hypothetical protein
MLGAAREMARSGEELGELGVSAQDRRCPGIESRRHGYDLFVLVVVARL